MSAAGAAGGTAHFILWYGFLRLITDHYREYGNTFLGVGTGQYFNLFMTVMGLGFLVLFRRLPAAERKPATPETPVGAARRVVFAGLLIFCLVIPSSWTKGVLAEYREKQKTEMETVPGRSKYANIDPGTMDRAEAEKILRGKLLDYRRKTYAELAKLVDTDSHVEVISASGVNYELEIIVTREEESAGGIMVLGTIDDHKFIRSFSPLAESFTILPEEA